MAPRLDDLPPELLLEICEYIDHTHRPSLKSLSLVNKALLKPCSERLFRTVSLHVSDPHVRQRSLEHWEQLLSRRDCLKDVRVVEFHGFVASEEDLKEFRECRQCQELLLDETGIEDTLDDHSGGLTLEAENEAFKPIAAVLDVLPSVSDVSWRCHNAVPQCVLDAASSRRPPLRLHVLDLKLLYLDRHEIGSQELAVLQSPSLYNVTVRYITSEMNGVPMDAKQRRNALGLIAGLAPNLKQLRAIGCSQKTFRPVLQSQRQSRNSLYSIAPTSTLVQLERFELRCGPCSFGEEDLFLEYEFVDATYLRGFHLDSTLVTPHVPWLWSKNKLEHLQELTFPIESTWWSQSDRSARAESTRVWLTSIPQLRSLSLIGPLCSEYVHVVLSALEWHGPKLKKFVLSPPMRTGPSSRGVRRTLESELESMSRACPVLEELSMPWRRRQDSRAETLDYQALASFPNLTHISLQIDCSFWALDVVDGVVDRDPQDCEPWPSYVHGDITHIPTGRVRRALHNAAFDESLALQIWNSISFQRRGRPLKWLKVGTMDSGAGDSRFSIRTGMRQRCMDVLAIFQELERTYVVQKSMTGDDDRPTVQEVDKLRRERRQWEVCGPEGPEMRLFRSIWPPSKSDSIWRDDWHSFPPDKS